MTAKTIKVWLKGYARLVKTMNESDYFYILPALGFYPKTWTTYRGMALRWGWWTFHICLEKQQGNGYDE